MPTIALLNFCNKIPWVLNAICCITYKHGIYGKTLRKHCVNTEKTQRKHRDIYIKKPKNLGSSNLGKSRRTSFSLSLSSAKWRRGRIKQHKLASKVVRNSANTPSILPSFHPSILLSFYPSILLSFYPSILLSFYPTSLPPSLLPFSSFSFLQYIFFSSHFLASLSVFFTFVRG
jgi:hypothetical protein